jgi:lantibiotic modifying enzyme
MKRTSALGLLVLVSFAAAQESKPADPLRATVIGAIEWIGRQALPVTGAEGAVMFRANEESTGKPQAAIYGGTAGVLIFLENAAAILGDESAKKLADATAKGLLASRAQDKLGGVTWGTPGSQNPAAGLYVGDAGIGQAFLVRGRLRNDAEAKAVAVSVGEGLIARAKKEGDTMHWAEEPDIIFGAAGTSLFLLDLAAETGDKKFVDAALAAGRWLVGKAETERLGPESKGRRLLWKCRMVGNIHMPNFSHGTAGVSYALARIAAVTKDAACAEAAKDGAEWLLAHAIRDGDECRWSVTERSKACLGGWCHGPPGTARLFLLLHAQTGDARYLDAALASARWLMTYAKAAESRAGGAAKIPPSFCCGVAGALDFLCDLYRVTGKQEFLDFAVRAGDYLVSAAKKDGAGVKWLNGASSHENSAQEHGIDLMLGASGDALALLRLLTLRQNPDPIRYLPDRAVAVK